MKKGISLISITISIVVMLILASTVSVSLNYSINNAKKLTFAKEIYNIQNIVNEYVKENGYLPDTIESITINVSETEQFDSNNVLQVLDLTSLQIKNTNYGNRENNNSKDVYAISDTGKVYYVNGFKAGNKTYYTLTKDLIQMVEKNQNISISASTVVFNPSKVGWSNEGVSVNVIIPSDYTSSSVTATNGINVSSPTTLSGGKLKYTVNAGRNVGSYAITVNYIKNGISESLNYSVKVDKVNPTIYKDTNVTDTDTKIRGINASDSESGIKYFKYVEGAINRNDAAKYIRAYGRNIKASEINFEFGKSYTIYAEDKAGNFTIKYIDLDGNILNNIDTSLYVFGVRRNITSSSSKWERIAYSSKFIANASKNGSNPQNSFDNVYPWKGIMSYNYDVVNDKITAYYKSSAYRANGTNGEVLTKIPTFWYKRYQEDGYEYIYISPYQQTGYKKSEEFSVGRYKSSEKNNVCHSISGQTVSANKTITQHRNMAKALGNKFCQMDYRYFMLQMLYLVEYADYNAQEVLGNGWTKLPFTDQHLALVTENSTNRIIISSDFASLYQVGYIIDIGRTKGRKRSR